MSNLTAKGKSAVHHLNSTLAPVEKMQLHLMQAKLALPKNDDDSHSVIADVNEALINLVDLVNRAVEVVSKNNASQSTSE